MVSWIYTYSIKAGRRVLRVVYSSYSIDLQGLIKVLTHHKLKLSPQLQLALALGLANLNPPATNLSE